ncbi:PTS galactitol transporter subunit IIB [Lactococcus raffinolactis]|jgi:galactitol PTS system EIIB component|uniref:PTS galactitol transporter subunit IIB n=1 Tax=Pseudolactococcus raffinolactis TaxID=1366 RepID=A0A290Q9I8_9LACT|nr:MULTISPECIES: PTS sugar transporter subunit IIB [Lactococcus]MDN5584104.1 PTS sugar transporter subunit IIB [Lactobacillus sp.]MDN6029438.1 PTS sugar transporter subunit IIB [Lactococcus plantarum]ATC60572.1 PTS galactitol transporter subunit IIB [Lactococcus raffinolactis]MBW9331268.1 PTS galactitol transporter subunit IIB [Lactococcus raffinolactis]MCJ2003172.1 PTS sugar transporter subunit IIB [Lactococcus carnosus]
MKKIIVACGSGIATSTVALSKIQTGLESKGKLKDIQFVQTSLSELPSLVEGATVIVTTAQGGDGFGVPVVSGLGLITGLGVDKVIDEIIEKAEL